MALEASQWAGTMGWEICYTTATAFFVKIICIYPVGHSENNTAWKVRLKSLILY
jgi:hypothetical protein